MSWCKQPDIGLPRPDAIVYLTLSSEAAAQRGNYGEERYEQTDFQKKVADNFAALTEDSWKVGGTELRLSFKLLVLLRISLCVFFHHFGNGAGLETYIVFTKIAKCMCFFIFLSINMKLRIQVVFLGPDHMGSFENKLMYVVR